MTRLIVMLGLVLAMSSPLASHQLDEYLQATRLDISPGRISVLLDLTPGVSVAPQILAMVDRDGDSRVSPAEVEAYARRVLRDVSLSVDGRRLPLTLDRAESPSAGEMRQGMGAIRVAAFGEGPFDSGSHHVRFENVHQPSIGVYLVNALKPASGLTIRAQRRDVLQRHIDLDVEIRSPLQTITWLTLLVGVFAVCLGARARRAPRQP